MSAGDQPGGVTLETLREWVQSDDPLLNELAFHTAFAHPHTVPGLDEDERLRICLTFLEAALSGRYGGSISDGPYVLGILEHEFEDEELRALFADWEQDAQLAPLYEEAERLSR